MLLSLPRASIRTLHANSHEKKVEHAQSFCRCVGAIDRCNSVASRHAQWFDFQYPACRNTLQQGGQTRATCCAKQCRNMLRSNGTSVWPDLANARPTML